MKKEETIFRTYQAARIVGMTLGPFRLKVRKLKLEIPRRKPSGYFIWTGPVLRDVAEKLGKLDGFEDRLEKAIENMNRMNRI
jgi:hypothetical protein